MAKLTDTTAVVVGGNVVGETSKDRHMSESLYGDIAATVISAAATPSVVEGPLYENVSNEQLSMVSPCSTRVSRGSCFPRYHVRRSAYGCLRKLATDAV